jgi:outer membrane protein OmpA-like peptidoglycan-associated protein
MLKRLSCLASMLVLAGCLPANVIVLVPDEGGTTGQVVVTENGVQQQLAQPYATLGTGQGNMDQHVYVADASVVNGVFAGALAARPRPPMVFVVYFATDEAEVDPGSAASLAAATRAALATPNDDIGVVGHADATGEEAENEALSLRRANAVRDALVAAGVAPSVIEIGYDGSNDPLVPSPRGRPEPRNRRVEVTIR